MRKDPARADTGSIAHPSPTGGIGPDTPHPLRKEVSINAVYTPPWAVRDVNDHPSQALTGIAESVAEVGLFSDILVRESLTPGRFDLIAGHGRLHACRSAGRATIPARVYPASLPDEVAIRMMLDENDRRSAVEPLTKARWFKRMMEREKLSQKAFSKKYGPRQPEVNEPIKVLDGPADVLGRIESGSWSFTRALEMIRAAGQRQTNGQRRSGPGNGRGRPVKSAGRKRGAGTATLADCYQIVAGLSVPVPQSGFLVAVVAPVGERIDKPLNPSEAVAAVEALLSKLRLQKGEE